MKMKLRGSYSSSCWRGLKTSLVSCARLPIKPERFTSLRSNVESNCPSPFAALEKIGNILSRNFHKLPAKVQELGSSTGPGDLLQRLNLLTRDRVLDEFLQEHHPCRRLFSELLCCRYSYLKEQESTEDTNGDGDHEISLAASFSEDFKFGDSVKTDSVSWLPVVKGIYISLQLAISLKTSLTNITHREWRY